ncbi:hypothetical protein BDN70DRAFT_459133 [Pholiota conissans]|uniref:Methyltransferase domain-containing protein n=1 Tax=Pholiota conissans TaxID=109636 RepID=A0A9P6D7G6_9AGAR|nr:hypothetical protein BDN70DRAFT_459133 [Pholiota conissans]
MTASLFRILHYSSGSLSHKQAQESTAHARQSTSAAGAGGAVAQALAEFGLRRRRSTGASGAEPVASGSTGNIEGGSATVTKNTKKAAKLTRMSTSGVAGVGGVSSSDMMPPADAAAYPGPHPASTAAATSLKRKGKGRADTVNDDTNDRFSTADRTILEELTASIRAREAQFKLKGVGHTVLGGGRSPGKKYHPYATDEVPYPRAYGKDVIDLDVWETLYFMDMTDSLSFHVFETPPTKVLEIGCGTGTWLLHGARTWKECHFVGLDIVPLHPDLRNVGSPDLASRITWVQHNFLEGLPFQNEEFDFVHIKRIALGVPENKWDLLFEEVARVMKPGARLEIIEEDLFFPGKKADDDDDDQATFVRDEKSFMMRRDSTSSDKRRTSLSTNGNDEADRETVRLEDVSEQSEVTSPPTPKSHNVQLLNGMDLERPASPSRTANVNGHPVSSQDHLSDHLKFAGGGRHHQRSHLVFPPARDASGSSLSSMAHDGVIPPHSRSTSRPILPPKPKDPYPEFTLGTSSAAVLGVMAYHDPFVDEIKKQRKQEAAARKNNAPMQGSQKTKPSPLLTTLMTKGPINPRDHTILEAIWEGMLEARFVNSTPTSVLQTYLEYHFTGIRTHPPLIYTFPPIPPKVEESDDEDEPPSAKLRVSGPSESDTDDARDAIVTRPKPKAKPRSNLSSNSVVSMTSSEEKRYLSMVSLVQRESPFVSFDNARTYAYSPAKNALFRANIDKRTTDKDSLSTSEPYIMPRMPNTTLHIDLNPLNMQLTLRAKEIVACSESMWEWVEELQNGPASDKERSGMATPWYVGGVDAMADSDVTRSIILDMTREDFDRLLCNFEWDMLDKACMGQALADRFNWHTFEGALLADRKAYNKACMDYDKWLEKDLKLKAAKDAYQCTQNQSHNPVSSLGGVLSPPDLSSHDVGQIARSSSNPESSSASLAPSIRTLMDDRSLMATLAAPSRTLPETASAGSGSGVVEAASMVSSIPSSQMLPQQMLSRAIRVFVAWKAM